MSTSNDPSPAPVNRLVGRDAWINTDDELPPDGKLVLIYPAYGPMMVSFIKRNPKGRPFFYAYSGRKVSHWMPLPCPPNQKAESASGDKP
jgi:hypothetical protein